MRWLKAYPTLLKVNFSSSIEYRGQMIIWILASVLPLVMMMVWISLVDTQGPINGFGSMDFVAYYLMVLLFRRLTGAWIIWDMDYDIREGMLSPQLLKPLNPIHRWLAHVLGSKPIQIVFVLPPIAIAALLLGIQYDLAPLNLAFVLIATWGALLIGFFAQAIIGSLAFWITQAVAIADVYFWISSFLSGWIIPLAMFPIGVQIALIFLPFRYSLAFPIEIILGRLTPDQLAVGFVMQYTWVVLFIAVFQWVWRRGLKLYGAVGA